MNAFTAELVGTAIIIIFGGGVVANVLLDRTKGNQSGLITIVVGWAVGVFLGVSVAARFSGAHLNPAVTFGLVLVGKFEFSKMPAYVIAQMLGAMLGAFIVWIAYKKHFDATEDGDAKLAVFCTAPNIRSYRHNVATEVVGTFVLVLAVLFMAAPEVGLGALDALPVALVVLGIGVSLGGPTGYAINPARDLGPRIVHWLLPMPFKRDSDWSYSWVPIVAPFVGAAIAAGVFLLLQEYS